MSSAKDKKQPVRDYSKSGRKNIQNMTEAERREHLSQRNVKNLRRSRERRKQQEIEDRRLFEENEQKMRRLEKMVHSMEKELRNNRGK